MFGANSYGSIEFTLKLPGLATDNAGEVIDVDHPFILLDKIKSTSN
jgi:hypothetical protein